MKTYKCNAFSDVKPPLLSIGEMTEEGIYMPTGNENHRIIVISNLCQKLFYCKTNSEFQPCIDHTWVGVKFIKTNEKLIIDIK